LSIGRRHHSVSRACPLFACAEPDSPFFYHSFNEEHADIEMPPGHHGQEVLKRCLDAVSVDSDEYARAKADMKLVAGKRGLDAVMDEYDLDALFMIREGHHSAANMVGYPIGKSDRNKCL
jgi:hypothetical protein